VVKVLGKQLQVQVSGVTMAVKLADVSLMVGNFEIQTARANTGARGKSSRLSKSVEKALNSEPGGNLTPSPTIDTPLPSASVSIRTDSNTVDVRGSMFEEARELVKDKISTSITSGRSSVVYVLHGHGTAGVLKSKIRGWLTSERQLVKRWAPAEQTDGGDAYTRLEIR
jgi:dsDNA-specific endonuclease/ATPase MutS2